ncbi:MAG: hypothetical protein JO353_11410 [Phycisphaerae bacterium]|nr:hypothetical protein [Phycisphaerae bacterium]
MKLSVRSAFLMVVGAALFAGCSTNHPPARSFVKTAATTRPAADKPIVDFGHGAAGFPLVGKEPIDSRQHLLDELTAGYAARVAMPTTRPVVTITGELPRLSSLVVDLSGGQVRSAYRPTSLKGVDKSRVVGHVDHLQYIADPLLYHSASQRLIIDANDVMLSLLHGRGEKEVLVMSDVGSGSAYFRATVSDLNALLKAAASDHGGSAAFFVTGSNLELSSDDPHSLAASLRIDGFFLVIPTSLTMTGRIDIDSNYQATMSHLSCTGGNVGGPLVAGFINDRLKKYEGKRVPLAAFPGDRLRISDLAISVDEALTVKARFGR